MYSGKKIILRSFEMADVEVIHKNINTWAVMRSLGFNLPRSQLSEEEWVRIACKQDPWNDKKINFAVLDKSDNKLIGSTGLFNISPQHRRAEFSIVIFDTENHGKGFGTDTTEVMLWVAFHILNFHSIHLSVSDFNERGIKAYEKAGFQRIGEFRESFYIEGKYNGTILMDILKEDFLKRYPPGKFVYQLN